MSWSSRVLGFFGVGRLSNDDEGLQLSGDSTRRTEAQIVVTDERAMAISSVWRCAMLLSNSVATLPLQVYRMDGETRVPVNDGFAQLLNRRPNAVMNALEFRLAMTMQRVLWGNAYAAIERSAGRITALRPLRAEHMNVVREKQGVIRFSYESDQDFYNRPGQPPQVFHWRGPSPDGVIGLSMLSYARHALGISVSADRRASESFRGRPNGVLSIDKILTKDQRAQLRELYGNMSEATGNNQWWLLEAGAKWQDIGVPPDDLQMLETRKFQVEDIARFFGVPSVMIDGAANSSAWPASYEKQVLAFHQFTLRPLLEEFEAKVHEAIAPDGVYVEHDYESFLRADSITRAQRHATLCQNGIMTRNEARRREGLPPVPGGDELTVQLNLTPLDKLPEAVGVTDAAE